MKFEECIKRVPNFYFYYNFLKTLGLEIEGSSLKSVGLVMAALETEFKVQGNGFPKHFGNDVIDQRELFGYSWQDTTGMDRTTFKKAFAQIGETYLETSYKSVCNSVSEFKDLFYCRVKTSYKKRTYYYRSNLVDGLIKDYEHDLKNAEELSNQDLGVKE